MPFSLQLDSVRAEVTLAVPGTPQRQESNRDDPEKQGQAREPQGSTMGSLHLLQERGEETGRKRGRGPDAVIFTSMTVGGASKPITSKCIPRE
jgi:hypothetical protein